MFGDMPASDETAAGLPSRGTRRRQATRRKLTDAAGALIAEKGVAGLRIQELTGRADVALGSFYNHFASKEELVEAVVTDTIDARAQAIVADLAAITDPARAVSFATRRVIRIAYEDPDLAWLFVNLDRADVLFEAMVLRAALRTLDDGVAAGRFDVPDTHMALTVMVGGALALMRGILDGRYGEDADTVFAEAQLRALGLPRRSARSIATAPLPLPAAGARSGLAA
jgi:AcrR family transcriptional regulator